MGIVAAMRCPECGQTLIGVPESSPCPECGTPSTLAERHVPPLLPTWKLVVGMAWPTAVGVAMVLSIIWILDSAVDGAAFFVALGAIVMLLVIGPIKAAVWVHVLMGRLPRRVRAAPLLALIPRSIAVPLLVAAAVAVLNAALGFGACLVTLSMAVRR